MPMSEKEYQQRQEIYQYYRGLKEGIRMYAWWKDGEQQVGTCGTTLKDALAELDNREHKAYTDLALKGDSK